MAKQKPLTFVILFAIALAGIAAAAGLFSSEQAPSTTRTLAAADVDWGFLNPLRGDKSPRAGTLWGDRGAKGPSGFLVGFVDGFSSPPHIHPVTYRGVVVSGEVHNDDPDAEERWLPAGSFWTQPAGDIHITAAKGSNNIAYIEIEQGPYLVKPVADAFEQTEQMIMIPKAEMPWEAPEGEAGGAMIAKLAGNPGDAKLTRTLIKLPAGFSGKLQAGEAAVHAVVIQGAVAHTDGGEGEAQTLEPGSYFGSESPTAHHITAEGETLVYVRTRGTFSLEAK